MCWGSGLAERDKDREEGRGQGSISHVLSLCLASSDLSHCSK